MKLGQIPAFRRLSEAEWEALCDGCGRCCLHKLEDEDSGEIALTRVACRLLDIASCRCTDYKRRLKVAPDCMRIKDMQLAQLHWLPPTCAYRLLALGKPLPDWHPLLSGDPESVRRAGVAVSGFAVSESAVQDFEDYLLDDWPGAAK
jgi:uncharacterized protein